MRGAGPTVGSAGRAAPAAAGERSKVSDRRDASLLPPRVNGVGSAESSAVRSRCKVSSRAVVAMGNPSLMARIIPALKVSGKLC